MSEIMLRVDGIDVNYGGLRALQGVSLEVKTGEKVALIGSNGAGKTTTLNTIMGALRQTRGCIYFLGKKIDDLRISERVSLGISISPEGRRLFPEMTVLENLIMGSYVNRADRGKMMNAVFALFPVLEQRKNQLASTLSGGEQQMLAIGRALMANPKLLLLDEVSLGLAPKVIDAIYRVIRELNSEGMTILFVEQDIGRAFKEAERVYVLEAGKIVLSGSTKELSVGDIIRKYFRAMERERNDFA